MSKLWLPLTARGARYVGDMVLDPVAGSGTAAEAALLNQRRFIAIDMNSDATGVIVERLAKGAQEGKYKPQVIRHSNRLSNVRVITDLANLSGIPYGNRDTWDFWLSGDSYVVTGDAIQVMRTMPEGTADLIYCDPPFGSQREYKGRDGRLSFDDRWEWDADAEARLAELDDITPEQIADLYSVRANVRKDVHLPDIKSIMMLLELVLHTDRDMASYLTFAALLLLECHRVCGGVTIEPMGFGLPDWVQSVPG